jgi:hypothetical protein
MRFTPPRAALLCLCTALLSSAPVGSAEAQYYHRRATPGAAIAGGIAAGAIINSTRAPVYAAPVYGAPVYAEPEPVYVPTCHIVRRKVWLDDYAYTFRRERVCD